MREYFISVHFHISIQSIFACCLWLQEAKPSDPTGAVPLDPAGDFRSPGLFFCTPYSKSWLQPWLEQKLYRISFTLRVGVRKSW